MRQRVVAIDWSGRSKGAAEAIWLAEVADGQLVDLRNGSGREEVIDGLVARPDRVRLVVGLDFAFSFPAWWCRTNGWRDARAVWDAAAAFGDDWLRDCPDPFWGRAGKRRPDRPHDLFRRTDREITSGAPKAVFQIGGAGAVGTGSIRGMPHLRELADAGFAIWPFDDARDRTVVEIYPRALTGARVRKSSWRCRQRHLLERFCDQQPALLERAAGSEDAFDAAISALAMSSCSAEIGQLARLGHPYRIEGCIWTPPVAGKRSP